MKIIINDQEKSFLRFDFDEELIHGITVFCRENNITAGYFSVIGATREIVLSFYDLKEKTYIDSDIKEDLEIASLTGNIGLLKGEVAIHAHGVFGKKNLQTTGGHVKKAIISGTGEVMISKFPANSIERGYNKSTGLNLIV